MKIIQKIEKAEKLIDELLDELKKLVLKIKLGKASKILGMRHQPLSRVINREQKIRAERIFRHLRKLLDGQNDN